jgi:hypothetical protein
MGGDFPGCGIDFLVLVQNSAIFRLWDRLFGTGSKFDNFLNSKFDDFSKLNAESLEI